MYCTDLFDHTKDIFNVAVVENITKSAKGHNGIPLSHMHLSVGYDATNRTGSPLLGKGACYDAQAYETWQNPSEMTTCLQAKKRYENGAVAFANVEKMGIIEVEWQAVGVPHASMRRRDAVRASSVRRVTERTSKRYCGVAM